jgi:hypothetical protein
MSCRKRSNSGTWWVAGGWLVGWFDGGCLILEFRDY